MNSLPTSSPSLPLRRGGFGSIAEALDFAARGDTGLTFWSGRGQIVAQLPWREARERALVLARRLRGAGFQRGERMLIVADTAPEVLVAFFACQYAGLLPAPVSVPAGMGARQGYVEQLERQLVRSGAVAAMAPDDLAGFLAEAVSRVPGVRLHGGSAAFEALPDSGPVEPLGADERGYLQFSSGSTRFPLGVDLWQRSLAANLDGIINHGLDVVDGDRAVSWLPLYHDMGLIGFVLSPLYSQRSVDLMKPGEFARRPAQWLKLISQLRASISYSPSFGYDLVTRRMRPADLEGVDLSCWRIAGIGADMIQPPVLRRFAEAFALAGFDAGAFLPSYGMAETCLALSFAHRGDGVRIDRISRAALTAGRAEPAPVDAGDDLARDLVLCGRPLPGHDVEIRDERGAAVGERAIGRIFARGPSVMSGYFNAPEETAAALSADGWLDTGDLGYRLGGQLVITGRAKDLIIVNGRNVWPQDIEWAVEALPELKRGDAGAFSVDGEDGAEKVVVLVQAKPADPAKREPLRAAAAQAAKEATGLDVSVVLVSPAVGLPMTSSGKLSRSRAKAIWLAGGYAEEA